MPWKVSCVVSERMSFVARLLAGERMVDLCAEFGISRKTGYKLKDRYELLGPVGLYDVSRRPHRTPSQTPVAVQQLVIEGRQAHPTWGPKKLRPWLMKKHPGVQVPCSTTIGDILARRGLVTRQRRKPCLSEYTAPLQRAENPNDVWGADYKGQFRLGNGSYCYPLTVSDQFSRYLLACEGFEAINGDQARAVFEDLFAANGLPRVIRTDNGPPFASRGVLGLSRLSAWWLKLGIVPERIAPAHPEQNGRHERMHRTLKAETTRPSGHNLLQQQERFDLFTWSFNHERPHEALNQQPPAQVYQASPRRMPATRPLDYPLHDEVRFVARSGHIQLFRRQAVYLSAALAGERVGLRELESGLWLVSFVNTSLGWIDPSTKRFLPIDRVQEETGETLSPMSPV